MSPLLLLPFEIRIQIYEILYKRNHLPLISNRHENDTNRTGLAGCTALLRTCRQINQEASSVLYGQNIFQFDDISYLYVGQCRHEPSIACIDGTLLSLPLFIQVIGRENRLRLRHLRLGMSYENRTWCQIRCDLKRPKPATEAYDKSCAGCSTRVALELLSSAHNLSILEIEPMLEKPPVDDRFVYDYIILSFFRSLFRNPSDSAFMQLLLKFGGLGEFRCDFQIAHDIFARARAEGEEIRPFLLDQGGQPLDIRYLFNGPSSGKTQGLGEEAQRPVLDLRALAPDIEERFRKVEGLLYFDEEIHVAFQRYRSMAEQMEAVPGVD